MPGPIAIGAMPSRGWATGHSPMPIARWSTGLPGVRPAGSSSGRPSRRRHLLDEGRVGRPGRDRSERPGPPPAKHPQRPGPLPVTREPGSPRTSPPADQRIGRDAGRCLASEGMGDRLRARMTRIPSTPGEPDHARGLAHFMIAAIIGLTLSAGVAVADPTGLKTLAVGAPPRTSACRGSTARRTASRTSPTRRCWSCSSPATTARPPRRTRSGSPGSTPTIKTRGSPSSPFRRTTRRPSGSMSSATPTSATRSRR